MDLFTHVIFAYLLSFIIWGPAAPQFIAAGALAGGLPDADVLLFPLTRWFPSLHHRGTVHTIVGVTIIAAAGSFLVPFLPYFTHASTLLYFVAMEIGGLSHLLLDAFTNYAVRPLYPFSARAFRLNADVAVSLVTMAPPGSLWSYSSSNTERCRSEFGRRRHGSWSASTEGIFSCGSSRDGGQGSSGVGSGTRKYSPVPVRGDGCCWRKLIHLTGIGSGSEGFR